MGYTTDLYGTLKFNRQLTVSEKNYLEKFANTRRMARNVDNMYGVEGEFYVGGEGLFGQDREDNVIDHNRPPKTQPGLWCQWVPTEDGFGLEWDGNEKFYNYVEWLEYLIESVLPWVLEDGDEPLVLNGEIKWYGEDREDMGKIVVTNNEVKAYEARISYE